VMFELMCKNILNFCQNRAETVMASKDAVAIMLEAPDLDLLLFLGGATITRYLPSGRRLGSLYFGSRNKAYA
jgi:hypothetical protein